MTDDEKKEASKNLLAVLGIPVFILLLIIAFVPLGIFNAWAVQKMYIWFLLPLGAPALNLWHVFGISILIRHFTNTTSDKDKTGKEVLGGIAKSVISTLFMLLLGWIIKGQI